MQTDSNVAPRQTIETAQLIVIIAEYKTSRWAILTFRLLDDYGD